MSSREFTDLGVKALTSCGKVQFEHYDAGCAGLLLRVTSKKKKIWNFAFTNPVDGKRARLKIGPYPAITLAAARERVREARGKIAEHKDPRVIQEPPAPPPAGKTIAELIEDRLRMEIRGKKRSAREIERRFERYVTPFVGGVPVEAFRIDPHYNAVIDPILLRGRVRTAGTVFQDLRALLNFGIQRGVIEYSRLAKVKRPDSYAERTRFLSLEEIVTVWHALPLVMTRSDHTPTILRLCLATGSRLSEVAGIRRDEIDVARKLWTLPAARSKNKFQHAIPLMPLALKLITGAMRESNGDYLFPDRSGEGPTTHRIVDFALSKAQRPRPEQPMGRFGIPRWMPHDLRRTVATQMCRRENALGIPEHDIAHCLNHRSVTKSSITSRVYIQHDYIDEKIDAFTKWDTFLTKLIARDEPQLKMAAE